MTDSASRNGNGGDYVHELAADEQPSEAVLNVVAAVTNRAPTAFEPLAESVDPEALDSLFEGDAAASSVSVRFEYEGYEVTVTSELVRLRGSDGRRD